MKFNTNERYLLFFLLIYIIKFTNITLPGNTRGEDGYTFLSQMHFPYNFQDRTHTNKMIHLLLHTCYINYTVNLHIFSMVCGLDLRGFSLILGPTLGHTNLTH